MFDDIKEVLYSVLQPNDALDHLTMGSRLWGELPEMDSMAVVSILTALEEKYGFVVHDDEIDAADFETFGALVAFVERKVGVLT